MWAFALPAFADHPEPIDLGASGTVTEPEFDCAGDYFKIENAIENEAETQLVESEHDYVGTTKNGNPWSATFYIELDDDVQVAPITVIAMSPPHTSFFATTRDGVFTGSGPDVGPFGLAIREVTFCFDSGTSPSETPAGPPAATPTMPDTAALPGSTDGDGIGGPLLVLAALATVGAGVMVLRSAYSRSRPAAG